MTAKLRSAAVKIALRYLVKAGMVTADILAPEVMILAGIAIEVADAAYPYVKAYFDPPQTLEELQQAANSPESGYEIHHIVEQATASPDGAEDAQIDSPENLVRIPTAKHWDLNRWYERENEEFGGLSPRDYCKGKSWEERQRVGLEGLREIGVLTP
ncbi:MAG TPA: hypothetical protein VK558_07420 [Patescibacteria group bacterium]|nr:hypothetical protein [Patescibacteria group bacterium]